MEARLFDKPGRPPYCVAEIPGRLKMTRSTNPKKFLSEAETAAVHTAIKDAERRTSAEVKVVLARHCWGSIRRKARRIFGELGLNRTQRRNCVLLSAHRLQPRIPHLRG